MIELPLRQLASHAPIWMPVRGGSMSPRLRPGDQVLVDLSRSWVCGDVVVVGAHCGLVVHRIVAVVGDGARVITKGDAVRHCDRAVKRAAIVGVVIRVRRRRWWGWWQEMAVSRALGQS